MIYLVEDDDSIRELVLYTLHTTGFEAEGFRNAAVFWQALEKELPQLVLLDIMLPDEDGLHILKRLRAGAETADLPVMMLTAKSSEYDRVVGLDSGADDYMPKPFGMMELVSRVRALLRRAAKPAAEGAPAGAGRPASAALAEQEDPLARKMSYSAPEQALEESSIRGRRAAAARAASGVPAAPPRPAAGKPQTYVKDKEDPYANVGRNDPCPCGSGKKYKQCHGKGI